MWLPCSCTDFYFFSLNLFFPCTFCVCLSPFSCDFHVLVLMFTFFHLICFSPAHFVFVTFFMWLPCSCTDFYFFSLNLFFPCTFCVCLSPFSCDFHVLVLIFTFFHLICFSPAHFVFVCHLFHVTSMFLYWFLLFLLNLFFPCTFCVCLSPFSCDFHVLVLIFTFFHLICFSPAHFVFVCHLFHVTSMFLYWFLLFFT